jgi:hypothetical protein
MPKKQFATLTFGAVLMSVMAFAQEDYTRYKSDATVQALGSLLKDTTKNGVNQDTTNSGGVLATYRFWFDRHNGIRG